jgi:hypothetical protein
MRIIKYVIDTKNYTLCHCVKYGDNATIEGYCDSNYVGDKDTRRSVTGYAIYLNGCLIAWKSKSQRSVTLSSLEAEYVSILEIAKDFLFVKQNLEFANITICYPIIVHVNNIGAIYKAKNGSSSNQTKHINIFYHFVRELIKEGVMKIEFVKLENNNSDIFTKNLGQELFKKHSKKIMKK